MPLGGLRCNTALGEESRLTDLACVFRPSTSIIETPEVREAGATSGALKESDEQERASCEVQARERMSIYAQSHTHNACNTAGMSQLFVTPDWRTRTAPAGIGRS